MNTPTAEEALAAARALDAEADARDAAERDAKAKAATDAVKQLVASPEFKAALTVFEQALEAAPKNVELGYAVNMMERLAKTFAA